MNTSCGRNLNYYGTYCGKVLDKDTNQPIEGVVVAASWISPNFTDSHYSLTRPTKVAEVVSDKYGKFCLRGRVFAMIPYEPSIAIFKSGYSYIGAVHYPDLFESTGDPGPVTWENNTAIIKLEKLTIEKRDKQFSNIGMYIANDTIFKAYRKNFDSEIDKEKAELEIFWEQRRQKEYLENRTVIPIGPAEPPRKTLKSVPK